MNWEKEVLERLSREHVFASSEQALEYSVMLWKNEKERTSVFMTEEGQFACVHTVNAETAIQYGFKRIYSEFEIYRVSLSEKPAKEAIEELRNRVQVKE